MFKDVTDVLGGTQLFTQFSISTSLWTNCYKGLQTNDRTKRTDKSIFRDKRCFAFKNATNPDLDWDSQYLGQNFSTPNQTSKGDYVNIFPHSIQLKLPIILLILNF